MAARTKLPLFVLVCLMQTSALGAESHPLYIHMQHWLSGSGEWRTQNPDFNANGAANDSTPQVSHFALKWSWDEQMGMMEGELSGITTSGSRIPYWSLFAFYNPVTERVMVQQVGNGALIVGEQPVRQAPLSYGEVEVLETRDYFGNGVVVRSKHENIFHDNGCHDSEVFVADDDGNWQHRSSWVWCLDNGGH